MNQVLLALNAAYLLNEKGTVALTNSFSHCPQNYQKRVASAFALLAADVKSIVDAISILDGLEQDLRHWYGDRRLTI